VSEHDEAPEWISGPLDGMKTYARPSSLAEEVAKKRGIGCLACLLFEDPFLVKMFCACPKPNMGPGEA